MTIPRTQESLAYNPQTQTWTWKWEKRHILLMVASGCLILWWLSPQMQSWPLLQKGIKHLPTLGGLIFATDAFLKLTQ